MKTIKEYKIELYLEQQLKEHISIVFRDNRIYPISERRGAYDNLDLIIRLIFKELEDNNYKEQDYIINTNDNILSKIVISLNNSNETNGGYNFLKTDFDNRIFYIDIFYSKDTEKLEDMFYHELTHAYEDYNRHIYGKDTLKDIFDDVYNYASINIKSKQYHETVLSRLLYFLHEAERNAYISEITPQIKRILKQNNYNSSNFNYEQFLGEFKKLPIWNMYFNLAKLITDIETNLPDYKVNRIIELYNKINNDKKLVNKTQLVKLLNIKFTKFKNKFEQIVSGILKDNLLIEKREYYLDPNILDTL